MKTITAQDWFNLPKTQRPVVSFDTEIVRDALLTNREDLIRLYFRRFTVEVAATTHLKVEEESSDS